MKYKLGMTHLKILQERMLHATKNHPEGPSFEALTDEIIEVRKAMDKKNKKEIIYELYDVATVSMRLIMDFEDKNN